MSIEIGSINNYASVLHEAGGKTNIDKSNLEKKTADIKKSNEDYMNELQKNTPYIKLRPGNGLNQKKDSQVNVVDVSPKLLVKMQNDPEAARRYSQRIKDVEAAYKWADSYHKMKGNTVVCRHGYVDEDGNFSNFAIIKKNDGLNEKLRKEAEENIKKRIDITRQKLKGKADDVEKNKEESDFSVEEMITDRIDKSKDGSVFFDNEEMQKLVLKAKEDNAVDAMGSFVDILV